MCVRIIYSNILFFSSSGGNESEDDDHDRKLQAKMKNAVVGQKFDISYDDIVGLNDVKSVLNESVVFPLKYPSLMKKIGPWKGILLFGVSIHEGKRELPAMTYEV